MFASIKSIHNTFAPRVQLAKAVLKGQRIEWSERDQTQLIITNRKV